MAYEVLSRPGEKPKAKYEVVSKPKADERQPGQSLFDTYMRMQNEGYAGMKEGAGRAVAPGASAWERTKGAGQAAMGALGYAASPVSAVARRVLGNPAEVAAGAVGASPGTQTQVGDYAGIIGELLSGAGATKAPQVINAGRQMASEAMPALNRAAGAVGGVARSGINSAADVAGSISEGATRRAAAKAAEDAAVPSKETLRTAGGGELEAAKTIGGDIKPEVLQGRVGKLRENVSSKFDLAAEKTYPNTRDMIEYLERRVEGLSSFEELMTLRREAQNFVKRAKKAKETTGDGSDYAAAQRAMSDLEEFRKGLKAEDMVSGNPEAANEALRTGNELWARQAKMDVIEDVIDKAKRMNDPEYLQQEFRKIALDDYDMARFTDAERKLIDEIAAEGVLDKVSDVATGAAAAAKRAIKIGGTSVSGRIKKAERLLKEVAKGEAAQIDKAASKGPSLTDRVADTLGQLRPRVENTQTRRERGGR